MTFYENVKAVLEDNFPELINETVADIAQRVVELRDTPQKWIHRNDDRFDWLECPCCGYGDEGEVNIERLEDAPSIYCPCCGQKLEGVK